MGKPNTTMTPKEYVKFEREQRRIIEAAEKAIRKARQAADQTPPPLDDLRKARAEDIKPGLVVWHENGDEGWFWNIVDEPLHYGDAYKAYCADDGCRYGLCGAWVYTKQAKKT